MAGEILATFVAIGVFIFISWVWQCVNWLWLKPKKMEMFLREQGYKAPPYKFFFGDTKEMGSSIQEARSNPMEFSHQIAPRVLPFVHQMVQKYGKISYTWFGPTPRLNVMDSDMIKDILSDKSGDIGKAISNPLSALLVTGLIVYEGEKWAKHRKIVNPAFHLEKLKMMLPAFDTSCSEMVNKWKTLVSEGSAEFDVWVDVQNLAADVISRAAFGSSYEEGRRIFQLLTEQSVLFIEAIQSIYVPGLRFLPTKRNNRMKVIYQEIRTLLRDMIIKREKAMKAGEAHNNDLLGILMESNFKEIKNNNNSKKIGLSIDEVIEECKLFYFAGQETTSSLLVWTLILLSTHQDWQEKAREEVLQVFGKKHPDYDGMNRLKIVTMILNEVLRLYPPAVTIDRATYKSIKLGEVIFPPGVELSIPTLVLHHDPELWGEDAEEFNPERFSEGVSKATKNKLSFLPFSWGPRICIGQTFAMIEAKMAIAMILQRFSFELSSTYLHAPSTVIILKPQYGAQLILHQI